MTKQDTICKYDENHEKCIKKIEGSSTMMAMFPLFSIFVSIV